MRERAGERQRERERERERKLERKFDKLREDNKEVIRTKKMFGRFLDHCMKTQIYKPAREREREREREGGE